ncbi:hypothetical protein SDC9_174646 [bioreactor metagenome]|uniref:Uncharacterized protein n=1 Tax=bioreactor metagenome TaxID=1076179 RepID=A0A645GJX2_9ZZZZ
MTARVEEAIAGVAEEAGEGIDLQIQQRALIDIACPVDAHIALGRGAVLGHVVFHAVGADHRVAPAQFGVALDLGLDVGLARDLVPGDKYRQLRAHIGWDVLLQHGR